MGIRLVYTVIISHLLRGARKYLKLYLGEKYLQLNVGETLLKLQDRRVDCRDGGGRGEGRLHRQGVCECPQVQSQANHLTKKAGASIFRQKCKITGVYLLIFANCLAPKSVFIEREKSPDFLELVKFA